MTCGDSRSWVSISLSLWGVALGWAGQYVALAHVADVQTGFGFRHATIVGSPGDHDVDLGRKGHIK